jgi:alpha-glucosidase (family GH31 glycosyl hydrolase)
MFCTPIMPPMWALGWHSASKNYKFMIDLVNNVENYSDSEIPLEGIWLDTPYMDTENDFSLNYTAFTHFSDFI